MRAFAGITTFLVLSLLVAYVVGFQPDMGRTLPIDEEQTGLKDRIVIKFSHVVAENTPKGLAAAYFAQLVKEKSHDRVEIQVFPNGILYDEDSEFSALQHGEVQIIAPSFSNMNAIDPAWLVMDLPFAFRDQQEVDRALKGKLGQRLFETLDSHGVKGAAFWTNGFRNVTNQVHPLRTPADFRGLSFRIQPSQVLKRQYELLGASTISTNFNEVYRNLEAGEVDGQENTISNTFSKKLYQVQRYMTISNHSYLGYAVLINPRFWDGLPSDVRQLLKEALAETTAWNSRVVAEVEDRNLRAMQNDHAVEIITLSEEERMNWKKRLAPIYHEFTKEIGDDVIQDVFPRP